MKKDSDPGVANYVVSDPQRAQTRRGGVGIPAGVRLIRNSGTEQRPGRTDPINCFGGYLDPAFYTIWSTSNYSLSLLAARPLPFRTYDSGNRPSKADRSALGYNNT